MNNSQGDQLGLTLAYTVVLTELIVDLIGLPISSLNVYMISKTSIIHRNLKFILLCQSAAYLTRFICKLFIAIPIRLFGPFILWHESSNPITLFLFYSNVCFRTFLSHTILLERSMATLWAKKYEKSKSNIYSICWFSIAMFVVLCNAISQQLSERNNGAKATPVTLASSYVILIISFIEFFLFILLMQYNKKKLIASKEKEKFGNYILAERYQHLENVRTGGQLIPTLICQLLFLVALAQAQTWVVFEMIPNKFYLALAIQTNNLLDAILSMLAEIFVIIFHPFLRRDISKFLKKKIMKNRISNYPSTNNMTMYLKRENKEIDHFKMLTNSWEKKAYENNKKILLINTIYNK